MDLLNKRIKTEITRKEVKRNMVGPHMRQPIQDRIWSREFPNITLTDQTAITGIGAAETNGGRPTIVMLTAEANGRNRKLLTALGLSQNSLIPARRIL